MNLNAKQLTLLETPCLVIDVQQVRRNIDAMQRMADETGCLLRPHIKTHKMPLFARMQIASGACGITCAKVSEAEVMAQGGIQDIFIAYPMVGAFRINRAIALHKQVKRLILAVDSLEGAVALDREACAAGVTLEVRMEIDTGAGRTGVPVDQAVELAKALIKLQGLCLTGIFTFKSLVYQGKPTQDNQLAAREEGEIMAAVAQAIRTDGIELRDVSAGSTPTGVAVARTGNVTEIRPGTYIFNDALLCSEQAAITDEIAVRYVATVVSTPHKEYAVIDGGTKTFPSDIQLNRPPLYAKGYAIVEGSEDLCLSRMNEEHGIITSEKGDTGLKVGDILTLIPLHVCTAINQQNSVYLLKEDGTFTRQTVDARGMLV